MTQKIIELKNVHKDYVIGDSTIHAVAAVDLGINKGDFIAIVGPSGSGKSTMMNLVGALDLATEGDIFLDNQNIEHLEESELAQLRGKKIGFVFQKFNLIETLTALENVILPMTFPFLLGSATATQDITYVGTWFSYPVIEADGPTAGVYIENTTLGLSLSLSYVIPTGDTVTFDLSEGTKTVYDNNGNNLISYLSEGINLAKFVIERDPIVPNGVNSFLFITSDIDTTTEVRIKYYNKYVGI